MTRAKSCQLDIVLLMWALSCAIQAALCSLKDIFKVIRIDLSYIREKGGNCRYRITMWPCTSLLLMSMTMHIATAQSTSGVSLKNARSSSLCCVIISPIKARKKCPWPGRVLMMGAQFYPVPKTLSQDCGTGNSLKTVLCKVYQGSMSAPGILFARKVYLPK